MKKLLFLIVALIINMNCYADYYWSIAAAEKTVVIPGETIWIDVALRNKQQNNTVFSTIQFNPSSSASVSIFTGPNWPTTQMSPITYTPGVNTSSVYLSNWVMYNNSTNTGWISHPQSTETIWAKKFIRFSFTIPCNLNAGTYDFGGTNCVYPFQLQVLQPQYEIMATSTPTAYPGDNIWLDFNINVPFYCTGPTMIYSGQSFSASISNNLNMISANSPANYTISTVKRVQFTIPNNTPIGNMNFTGYGIKSIKNILIVKKPIPVDTSDTDTVTVGIQEHHLYSDRQPIYYDMMGTKVEKQTGVILIEMIENRRRKVIFQ